MGVVSISNGGVLTVAGRGVQTVQDKILDTMSKQVSGKAVSAKDTPDSLARLGNMRKQELQTNQYIKNLQTGTAITKTIIGGLQAQRTELEKAYQTALQAASGTMNSTELGILADKFSQAISAANDVAVNTSYNGTAVLNQTTGTGTIFTAAAATSGALTASVANTFATGSCGSLGNIFGTAKSVAVSAAGANGAQYNVTITLTDNGKDYTCSGIVDIGTASAVSYLKSSLDGQSYIKLTNHTAVTGMTTAAELKTAVETIYGLATVGAVDVVFSSESSAAGAQFAFDVTGGVDGAGKYRISQTGDTLTVISPTLNTYQVTVAAVSTTYYAGGVKITTGAAWATNASETGSLIGQASSSRYVGYSLSGTTSGYSASISAGASSISVTSAQRTTSQLGVSSLSATTVALATTAKTTLESLLTSTDQEIGRQGNVLGRLLSTADNLGAQNDILGDVIEDIENANLVDVSDEAVQLELQQQFAADAFGVAVQHQRQLMQKLGSAQ